MSDFHIGHLPIAELKPNPRNARRHSQKQLNLRSLPPSENLASTASWLSMRTGSSWLAMAE